MQTRFHVDSKEASHEVEAPQSKEHGQLSGIHTDFRPLYVVELGAMAAFAKIDHADTPQSGANVGHGPSHMGGTNNGTEVRCAHAFCKPHAAATRQTGSNLPGMKAADTSKLEFSTSAKP